MQTRSFLITFLMIVILGTLTSFVLLKNSEAVTAPKLVLASLINANYDMRHGPQAKDWGYYTGYDIRNDLNQLAPHFSTLRVFDDKWGNEMLPKIAAEYGVDILMGVDIPKNGFSSDLCTMPNGPCYYIDRAVSLAKEYSNIKSLIIGNEMAGSITDDLLQSYIAYAQKQLGNSIPVGSAMRDGPVSGTNFPNTLKQVDVVYINVYPFWSTEQLSPTASSAGTYLSDHMGAVRKRLNSLGIGTKQVVITETGWATDGSGESIGTPSDDNLYDYINVANQYAQDSSTAVFLFSAYDNPWKCYSGSTYETTGKESYECHFGLYTAFGNGSDTLYSDNAYHNNASYQGVLKHTGYNWAFHNPNAKAPSMPSLYGAPLNVVQIGSEGPVTATVKRGGTGTPITIINIATGVTITSTDLDKMWCSLWPGDVVTVTNSKVNCSNTFTGFDPTTWTMKWGGTSGPDCSYINWETTVGNVPGVAMQGIWLPRN